VQDKAVRQFLLKALGIVLLVAISAAVGFVKGASHTEAPRDCAKCHSDGRAGWEKP